MKFSFHMRSLISVPKTIHPIFKNGESITYRLQVWVLEESSGQMNWVLKHNNCLRPIMPYDGPVLGSWVLQDSNCNEYLKEYKNCNITPDDDVEQY